MPVIKINEVDKTTSGVGYTAADIVCVPGLAIPTAIKNYIDGGETGEYAPDAGYVPKVTYTLFTDLAEFEAAVGNKVPFVPGIVLSIAAYSIEDRGYVLARELLSAGIKVLYASHEMKWTENEGFTAGGYWELPEAEDYYKSGSPLEDKGDYDIKFVTYPGYIEVNTAGDEPDYGSRLTSASDISVMAKFAEKRGDCVAIAGVNLATAKDMCTETKDGQTTIAAPISSINSSYAAVFVGDTSYVGASGDEVKLGAELGYLLAYKKSVDAGNPNWLAIAGVNRGYVPNLKSIEFISNTQANTFQPRNSDTNDGWSLNAITDINTYGHVIWGNRTTKKVDDGVVAGNMLNTRNMISDIKKLCYKTAVACMFEQDTEVLWLGFKAKVAELLDRMKSGYGISGYKIIREKASGNATICAKVVVYPTYAVENFEITVVLENAEVTVE